MKIVRIVYLIVLIFIGFFLTGSFIKILLNEPPDVSVFRVMLVVICLWGFSIIIKEALIDLSKLIDKEDV